MSRILPGNENTLLHTHPYNLNSQPEKIDFGKENQTHMPFDMVLEMKPYLAPGQASPQTQELIGIISHQGTKDQGHYVAITKRGNEWTLYNDAITAQLRHNYIKHRPT